VEIVLFLPLLRRVLSSRAPARRAKAPPRRAFCPRLEPLEERRLLAGYAVTTVADSGPGSLRQAILDSNAHPGANSICFAIGSGAQTIAPASALPTITVPVVLDATQQPGFAGHPLIELDGSNAGSGANGLRITAGDTTVKGLVINRFGQAGILVQTNGGDVIQGNYLGTDAAGTSRAGNGLGLDVTSADNLIGGTTAGAGNLISGNRVDGLRVESAGATGNLVVGNYIGTDVTGANSLAAPGSNNGVVVTSASNTIGGTTAGARNVISGNLQQGIYVNGAAGTLVQGNYVGTDASGAAELSNGLRGITAANGASNNTFGGTAAGAGNVLSGNLQNGIELTGTGTSGNLIQGNRIGTDATGTDALPNHLRGVGISYGATANTVGGTAAGARNLISGNTQNGVLLDANTDGNVVQGNFIGTDVSGTLALPNHQEGVLLGKTSVAGPITNNLIGGTDPGAGNLIAGNDMQGVRLKDEATTGNLVEGNTIGADVTGATALANGRQGVLLLQGAHGNTIGGTAAGAGNLISGNAREGVGLQDVGTTANLVQGNWIGTDVTGTAALGNLEQGVLIQAGASGNTVGGTDAGAGNVISANGQNGVRLTGTGTSDNVVQGNYIGTDVTGSAALGNAFHGVALTGGASGNRIGGADAGAGNLISGNLQNGAYLSDAGTSGNWLQGNLIGTDATGSAALGNTFHGVALTNGASGNTIGGPGAGNVISANGQNGVDVSGAQTTGNLIQGNLIGTDATGTAALGNANDGVRLAGGASNNSIGGTADGAGNVISANGRYGVEFTGAGTTGNEVHGNVIGPDITGMAALGNGSAGVHEGGGAAGNVVGDDNDIAFNGP
jgi:titin